MKLKAIRRRERVRRGSRGHRGSCSDCMERDRGIEARRVAVRRTKKDEWEWRWPRRMRNGVGWGERPDKMRVSRGNRDIEFCVLQVCGHDDERMTRG